MVSCNQFSDLLGRYNEFLLTWWQLYPRLPQIQRFMLILILPLIPPSLEFLTRDTIVSEFGMSFCVFSVDENIFIVCSILMMIFRHLLPSLMIFRNSRERIKITQEVSFQNSVHHIMSFRERTNRLIFFIKIYLFHLFIIRVLLLGWFFHL